MAEVATRAVIAEIFAVGEKILAALAEITAQNQRIKMIGPLTAGKIARDEDHQFWEEYSLF
ncbi:conserved hypothetical protein [Ricinus communis]|uniref:Uncharacterized protein n=1 Tax=Ricinus communis TaxID=3988 RepID=B9RPU9_RICCO|nr:conserved hypothetical protein [Ricinus communis]